MLQTVADAKPRSLLGLPAHQSSLETCVAMSIRDIGRDAWNACFPNEVEDYDYLLAVEEAGIEGFDWVYMALFEVGRLVAAMPAFLTDYQLETTVESTTARQAARHVRKIFPRFLTLRLACLGSPCTETGAPGFHPDIPAACKPVLLALLLEGFELFAGTRRCFLRGVKDFPETQEPALRQVFDDRRFVATPGMPTAWLDVDFTSIENYLERLSAGTRRDMRRKLKANRHIRTEKRTDFGDFLPRVMGLYNETRNRSDWQFEALTADYFTGVLDNMPGRSICFFYYEGKTLLAANILVHDENTLIDKFFCMDGAEGRKYNLYYLSWFNNLRYCLEQGIGRYQSGQAYYENKLRLGSRLTANTMYFKHSNPAVQWLLKLVAPLFALDEVADKPS